MSTLFFEMLLNSKLSNQNAFNIYTNQCKTKRIVFQSVMSVWVVFLK